MKITIESTDKIVELATGSNRAFVPARIWEGTTERGHRVVAFITRLTPMTSESVEEFEGDLLETRAPSPDVQVFPTRLIL